MAQTTHSIQRANWQETPEVGRQSVFRDILADIRDKDPGVALPSILARVGVYLGISRAILFRYAPDRTSWSTASEWCGKDIPPVPAREIAAIPAVHTALQDGGVLLASAGESPEGLRELLEAHGVLSAAFFPVHLHREICGFVRFDDCAEGRVWDSDTVPFLENIADLLSTVLARQETTGQFLRAQTTCKTVLDNIDSYVFVAHPESNEIVYSNFAFRSAFGENCEGEDAALLLGIDLNALEPLAPATPSGHAQRVSYPEAYCPKTGEWLSFFSTMADWTDGRRVRVVNCYNITDKKKYEHSMEQMAFQDHLTGLPNRYRCEIDLEIEYNQAIESGRNAVALFIDVDDFKVINDCYGHDYGDAVLVAFSSYLKTIFRSPNKVFRFGGDEFIVLINHQDADQTEAYLKTLLARTAQPWLALGKEFFCTLSIGVLNFPAASETPKTIIKHADIAMYEAKRQGKNKYEFYHKDLDNTSMHRSRMESLLRRSMSNNFEGFEIYYQPVVNTASRKIVGAEALVRMRDYDRILEPKDFISLAEYLGFIVPVGDFVLRSAAEECRKIRAAGYDRFKITVNMSVRQLNQKDITQQIAAILDDCGADYDSVSISVSENVAIDHLDRVLLVFERLRELGIDMEMDDFGGGRSSFLKLNEMPIVNIKTSQLLVQNLDEGFAGDFLNLIINLGHSAGKRVCISGVESQAQMDFCTASGAEELQGFQLYPALRQQELERLLGLE